MAIIRVDLRSRKSISEQLIESITDLVLHGFISPDEQLPSVRTLATELGINPNTIQKAYSQLENDGIIYSLAGRGNFATPDVSEKREEKQSALIKTIWENLKAARKLGAGKERVLFLVEDVWGNEHD